jgi:hypothetical protein
VHRAVLAAAMLFACGGSGEPPPTGPAYPTVGIGTKEGDVIRDYAFVGFVDPGVSHEAVEIRMGHFYNPTGSAKFDAADSFDDSLAKPRAIVISTTEAWELTKTILYQQLPQYWSGHRDRGLMVLFVLLGDNKPGSSPTLAQLQKSVVTLKARFPCAIDAERKVTELLDPTKLPTSWVVNARTMQIVSSHSGAPDEAFWGKALSLL